MAGLEAGSAYLSKPIREAYGRETPCWLQLLCLVHQSLCFRLSKMAPSYGAGGVKQEFCDSGDVAIILASTRDQQIITADHLGFAIGKQGKRELGLLAQFL